jgi:hypothetical protein
MNIEICIKYKKNIKAYMGNTKLRTGDVTKMSFGLSFIEFSIFCGSSMKSKLADTAGL